VFVLAQKPAKLPRPKTFLPCMRSLFTKTVPTILDVYIPRASKGYSKGYGECVAVHDRDLNFWRLQHLSKFPPSSSKRRLRMTAASWLAARSRFVSPPTRQKSLSPRNSIQKARVPAPAWQPLLLLLLLLLLLQANHRASKAPGRLVSSPRPRSRPLPQLLLRSLRALGR
jgi:hypothetical protein